MLKKTLSICILTAITTVLFATNCFAYNRSYSDYRAEKEREYQRYQAEKERSYQNNRNKSYSERRQEYDSIYQKHADNNEYIYNKYHDSSSYYPSGGTTSNTPSVAVPTQPANIQSFDSLDNAVMDITKSWIYGTWVQQDNPSVTLTIGSFSSTKFGGVSYSNGTAYENGSSAICRSYSISLDPRGLSNISSEFVKTSDNTAQVTITTSFTDMQGNRIPLNSCVLNMIKI